MLGILIIFLISYKLNIDIIYYINYKYVITKVKDSYITSIAKGKV